ncbi:MAG: LLM class F420-dependent oxidoreductase [Acidobacteria bacterium]|nr:LLM class F420-dependent oxidoreductase [Acidobacteriota bacterium]
MGRKDNCKVDYGITLTGVGPMADPEKLRRLARKAEEVGFHSVWLYDHVAFPTQYSESYGKIPFTPEMAFLEPITTLAYLAAETRRIRLGTGILLLALRHPLHVAKAVSTLDVVSGGRAILGVGLGWLAEEFEALGSPFHQRVGRLREAVDILRKIWRTGKLQHEGRYFRFAEVTSFPLPVQPGGPPIWFGGAAEGALRRAAELGDGWLGSAGRFQAASRHVPKVKEFAAQFGNNHFTVAVGAPPEISREDAETLKRLGVEHINLTFTSGETAEIERKLDSAATRLFAGSQS